MRLSISLLAASMLLSGCMVAQGYTEKEQSIVDSMDGGRYQPASRQERDNVETQSALAQATFWSREAQLNPADLESAIKLTAAVRKMGNAGQAVNIAQMARSMHPKDPYLLAEFAASLIADERGKEAQKPLQQGLRTTPAYGRLWSLMGAALDQEEKYTQARRHYERALQITPNSSSVLANMGLSFALEGDAATAETWLRRAAAQPDAGAGVEQNLALVLELQGKPTEGMMAEQKPAPQYAQHPTWGRHNITGPAAQQAQQNARIQQAPPTRPGQRQGQRQEQPQARQFSSGQQFSGQPRSASDAARMAARNGQQGRKVSVPMGGAVPNSTLLNQQQAPFQGQQQGQYQGQPAQQPQPSQQPQSQQRPYQGQNYPQYGAPVQPQSPQNRRRPARRR